MRFSLVALLLFAVASFTFAACSSGTGTKAPGSVSGTVTVEGDALAGVTVQLTSATATTQSAISDASGSFSFQDVMPGDYQVTISGWPTDVTFTSASQNITVTSGGAATAQFSGSYVRTASITGTVQVDGQPKSGVSVTLSGPDDQQTTTDATGSFSFQQLAAGDYMVQVSDGSNVVFDQDQQSVTVSVGGHASATFTGHTLVPAQVDIVALEKTGSSLRFNPDDVYGDANVVVKVLPGSQSATHLTVYLGNTQVGAKDFNPALQATTQVKVLVHTADFDPTTGQPLFPNGGIDVRVVLDTQQDGTGAASDTYPITLNNRDQIASVETLDVGDGVVAGGHRWYGNRDLTFQVTPVLFDQSLTVGAIELQATGDPSANGGPSLDLGAGPGQPQTEQGPPFVFTASKANNEGVVEDSPSGQGTSLRVVRVFDANGVDVTSSFLTATGTVSLDHFYVDFMPPQVVSGAGISVGGQVPTGGEWYSSGKFGITNLTETGSGGAVTAWAVDDAEQTDPWTGLTGISGLPEGLSNRFQVRVLSIRDAVGNSTDAATFPPESAAFGVDRSAVAITEQIPTTHLILSPNDAAGDGMADNRLSFKAEDPSLPDGNPASLYATSTAEATAPDGTTVNITPSIAPNVSGTNTIDLSTMADNRWTITVTSLDNAQPQNSVQFSYDITVDKTSPTVKILDPPPSAVSLNGTATFTIKGTTTDKNGLSKVLVIVRDADSAGGSAIDTCEPTDNEVNTGTAPGDVSASHVDVTSQVNGSTDGSFSTQITAYSSGAGTQSDLCFYVEASDNATDRNGSPEPNKSSQYTRTVVSWH